MAIIKPERHNKTARFLNTLEGEFCLVAASSALIWALSSEIFARLALFVSDTLYPFTYPFFHTPLHGFLPQIAYRPPFAANLIFGAFFGYAVYRFDKNLFYRRLNKIIRAAFGSVAACVFVFISGLLAFADVQYALGFLSPVLLQADTAELPMLFIYYFFATLGITAFCDSLRRRVFLLP